MFLFSTGLLGTFCIKCVINTFVEWLNEKEFTKQERERKTINYILTSLFKNVHCVFWG